MVKKRYISFRNAELFATGKKEEREKERERKKILDTFAAQLHIIIRMTANFHCSRAISVGERLFRTISTLRLCMLEFTE